MVAKEQKCQVIFFSIAISNLKKKTLFLFLDTERSSSKRWIYWFKVSAVKVFSETFIKRIVSIDLVHSLYV